MRDGLLQVIIEDHHGRRQLLAVAIPYPEAEPITDLKLAGTAELLDELRSRLHELRPTSIEEEDDDEE